MLYSASSLALCCLEVLVHTDADLIPDNYVWSWTTLPTAPDNLDELRDIRDHNQTQSFGKYWIESRQSLAIAVPSVIIPRTPIDFNVLLNPLHDAFDQLPWERGGSFDFDDRLLSGAASA